MTSTRQRAGRIVELLRGAYPDASCELDHRSIWELLVATVLSAQCTDHRVNQVTPELFKRWPGPADLAAATQSEVEEVIRSTGMFRQKAKSLRSSAEMVVNVHEGVVPADLDLLVALPGVGRKTAKVVLGEGYGISAGVTVDTHVRRLSTRLGLTRHHDAEKVAADLEALLPRDQWIRFSTRVILHGRRVCSARKPKCDECVLAELCPRIGVD